MTAAEVLAQHAKKRATYYICTTVSPYAIFPLALSLQFMTIHLVSYLPLGSGEMPDLFPIREGGVWAQNWFN